MPASPSDSAPSGSVACLRTPASKSAYGRRIRSATSARDVLDLALEVGADLELAPGDPRDDLDRAVVVRRPEAARDGDEVRVADGLAERPLELGRIVADDVDPRRLEPEREQRAREERAVQVGALAADELAARDDDRRPRPLRGQARSAAKTRFAVTKIPCRFTAGVSFDAVPVQLHDHVPRRARRGARARPVKRCFWPRSSVPE